MERGSSARRQKIFKGIESNATPRPANPPVLYTHLCYNAPVLALPPNELIELTTCRRRHRPAGEALDAACAGGGAGAAAAKGSLQEYTQQTSRDARVGRVTWDGLSGSPGQWHPECRVCIAGTAICMRACCVALPFAHERKRIINETVRIVCEQLRCV